MKMQLHPFRPRLLDALKGYNGAMFARDVGAGLTVGIVALPLAMAFAIASGVKPEAGIFTAIIAGFLISALGGSTVQIGGPAGAFIVIVYGIVERYGLANLLIATSLAGVLLFLMGLFKLGALVRYVPVPIIIGFTNGIAVLIALSQVKDLLGLSIAQDALGLLRADPGAVAAHRRINPAAVAIGLACLAVVCCGPSPTPCPRRRSGPWAKLRRLSAHLPGTIIALVAATLVDRAVQPAGGDHRFALRRHPAVDAGLRAARAELVHRQATAHPDGDDRAAGGHRIAAVRARGRQRHRRRATIPTKS
jgi:sulfate permease, SulP family